ncbi:MAG: M16 family metallopeptidase [Alphaproteobacteria bacterium]
MVQDRRAPIVTHMAWYKVGAIDEFSGKTGLAHFLEHLMFKGTETIPAGEFSKTISRNGGRGNAFTSWDFTAYYQQVAADRLELVMTMESDRMNGLIIAKDEVDAERDVVIEERRTRVENSPNALFREQVRAAQFLAHPYRLPIIGWMHDIEGLTRDDALGFYKTYYAPNNAVVIVVGDVEPQAVLDLAKATYGQIEPKDIPERIISAEPPQKAPRELVMNDARVSQPNWSRSYIAPSYLWGDSEHAMPLQVLNDVLGSSTTSRLYQALVVDQGIAVDLSSWYWPSGIGPGTMGVGITPVEGQLDALPAAVDAVLADVMANGLTEEELNRSKRSLKAAAIYARDSGEGLANLFGRTLIVGRTIEDIEAWPERVDAVTNEDIIAAARHVFRIEHSVTGILLPETAAVEAGE